MATIQTVNITAKFEHRLCKVKNELGYFHCWEHYSEPVPAGLAIGSSEYGVLSAGTGAWKYRVSVCLRYHHKLLHA